MSEFCDCPQDGYCERYGREMTGRLRQICQGVDCDLGTAAAFREQWVKERRNQEIQEWKEETRITIRTQERFPVLLKTDQAAGDAVAMTAAIYSLHTAHPGKYLTAVESRWPEVFAYNPDVHYHITPDVPLTPGYGPDEESFRWTKPQAEVQMHYPAIHDSNERSIHFMQGYCEFLEKALNVRVPLMTNRPHLYFKPGLPDPLVENYWVVCSGGKRDFTNKLWPREYYDEVMCRLEGKVRFVQVGDNTALQPPLKYTKYKVGMTSLRHLFYLVRHARGVLCGVSLLMHVAAALEKPAVVVAGGREPMAWNAYPKQHYLHTVGMLPCTDSQGRSGACWRSRVTALGDNTVLDKDPCLLPVLDSRSTSVTPQCMMMIPPARVADIILDINAQYDGVQQ